MKALLILLTLLTFSFGGECRVESREVIRAVYGSGYVKSFRQVTLKAPVSGYVEKLLVKEGERVRRGKVVALIDSGGLKERINSLEIRISLIRKKLEDNSPFVLSFKHRIEAKKENLGKARQRYMRRRSLFEKGVIPREAFEEAQRLYRIAREDYEATLKTFEDRLDELTAELRYLEKEKEALEKELGNYAVRSPIDGIVLRTFVEEGDYVNHLGRDNRIATVGTVKKKVVLKVDEEFLPLIKRGQKVYVSSDAFPERVFEGVVSSFDLQSDSSRRMVEVSVDVSLPQRIPVDSVVEGNVVVDRLKTTVVPLRFVKNGYIILLVNGEKRKVKVSRVFDSYAEVLGFPPGTPCLSQE